MKRKRQFDLSSFLASRPAFTLGELQAGIGHATTRQTLDLLRHHLLSGRVQPIERGLYAGVPPGRDANTFLPDPFLVAAASRPDAAFCYHAALELHGVAQSVWRTTTVFTATPRAALDLGTSRIEFLAHPVPLRRTRSELLGVDFLPHAPTSLRVTGPERTLVDCLRQPSRTGGLGELLDSSAAWNTFDFDLLERILEAYDQRSLWAALGWLAEREAARWRTPKSFLDRCRRHRPRGVQYLVRGSRGGHQVREWNLILPAGITPRNDADAAD